MRSTNTWCYSGDSASASVSRTTKRAPASAPSLCATEPDFDVDQIVGVKNIKLRDPGELAAPAMQSYDPAFLSLVRPGNLLVGADNFGFGHPHYLLTIPNTATLMAFIAATTCSSGMRPSAFMTKDEKA